MVYVFNYCLKATLNFALSFFRTAGLHGW